MPKFRIIRGDRTPGVGEHRRARARKSHFLDHGDQGVVRSAGAGRQDEAKAEFEFALARFGSFAARAEFAIWAAATGDAALARQLYPELERTMARWNGATRDMNAALIRRLNSAMSGIR